jgi:hypothetical protein
MPVHATVALAVVDNAVPVAEIAVATAEVAVTVAEIVVATTAAGIVADGTKLN